MSIKFADTLRDMARKKTSLGCLFWIALILLVLVVFFFNRARIMQVMEETGFSEYLPTTGEEEPQIKRKEVEDPRVRKENEQDSPGGGDAAEDTSEDEGRDSPPDAEEEEKQTVEVKIEKEKEEAEETSAQKEDPKIEKHMRKSTVYFVSVDDAGAISLRKIVRPVYYIDSPLTSTLNTLLEGLTPAELNEGLLNLIPDATKIRGIRIKNRTAYIDFSEDLKFNPFGTEGLKAALRQIVYTATEFTTVDRVQILINGEKRSYLASEGIPIGKPLSRNDL